MVVLPEIGVGITYSTAMEPFLAAHGDLVDVVEFEPQTTWLPSGGNGEIEVVDEAISHLSDLGYHKLVHSINCPVGGTSAPDRRQIELLKDTVARLGSPWVSEHLSFNRVDDLATGFFLPPRQTAAGVAVAARSVRRLRSELGLPLAFETGVNYLAPRPDELDDGEFIARVANEADSGILLDLHNVYTNERNGRQSLARFLEQIPLDRVWEVHLAGGFWLDGFWLDAHSGAIPSDLMGQALDVVGDLPNLKAIIFEMYPAFADKVDDRLMARQLEFMHEMWSRRPHIGLKDSHQPTIGVEPSAAPGIEAAIEAPAEAPTEVEVPAEAEVGEWEGQLAALTVGREPTTELGEELAADPGVELVKRLSLEFRASMISSNLRRTTRLLLLALGERVMRMLLDEYRQRVTPGMYGLTEARSFASFLRELDVGVPQLKEVLAFETAVLETLVDGQDRIVAFDFDPLPMLLALSEGRLPDELSQVGSYEIEVTADSAPAMVA